MNVFCVNHKRHMSSVIHKMVFHDNEDDGLVYESHPIPIDTVCIQVLDKISGKVYYQKLKVGNNVQFGNINILLIKAFINAPDEEREIYALLKIEENKKEIFNNWLFASSPSLNLLEHQVYDVRVEFKNNK